MSPLFRRDISREWYAALSWAPPRVDEVTDGRRLARGAKDGLLDGTIWSR